MKPYAQLAFAIFATAVVGLMSFTAYRAEFLTDHVRQLVASPMTHTKSDTWWCANHGGHWHTETTSGPDEEAVCIAHDRKVEKAQLPSNHPPSRPPPGQNPPR